MKDRQQMIYLCDQAMKIFKESYDGALVTGGPISKPEGNSLVIDCHKTQHRLIASTVDQNPGTFAIGVVDLSDPDAEEKAFFDVLPEDQLTVFTLVTYMETKFAR